MAASVVANDPQAVQALLEQGVSPNVYLDSVPRAMNHVQHEVLSEKLGERFTLASLAAAMGNAASLGCWLAAVRSLMPLERTERLRFTMPWSLALRRQCGL